ncbi:flagellar assembly peptidoglycan hydrolase FlgJ [Vibrio sp. E150_011]
MIKNPNDVGFIHDISSLDKLRQQATSGDKGDDKAALRAAATQFESIFTSMMLKSMRDANTHFESDMMNSQNEQFYRQMLDDQMASELSSSGSMGLADMIVAQLSAGQSTEDEASAGGEIRMRNEAFHSTLQMPYDEAKARETATTLGLNNRQQAQPVDFNTPEKFVESLKPYADRAAKSLGVDPSLLLAQAALETGWGKKVVSNSQGSSNNLFNIKADRSWDGDKVSTQTLEYHQNVPVQERAAFRSYRSYEDSFNDYVQFLNDNPRYQSALKRDNGSESFIRDVHQAGYATDPSYADKVLRVKAKIDNMTTR